MTHMPTSHLKSPSSTAGNETLKSLSMYRPCVMMHSVSSSDLVFTGKRPNCRASIRAWSEERRRERCLERECRKIKGEPEAYINVPYFYMWMDNFVYGLA